MASIGSPTFDTALADSAYKKLNKLGKVAAAVKIGAVMLSTEQTDADTLGLYKDTAMLALSYAELKKKLVAYKAKMRKEVLKSNDDLQKQING